MSEWNTNITEAQTGDYVWLALPCGRVIRSYWMRFVNPPRFYDVPYEQVPVAWQPYEPRPIHPFELEKQEESAS